MTSSIPFERQEDHRMCGAASLNMAYRALGRPSTQAEIWASISPDEHSARTHLLAKDALERGISAAVVQMCDIRPALRRRREGSLISILNHRLNPRSRQGHFSVLVGHTDRHIVFHDPFHGPSRLVAPPDLDQMWRWDVGNREVSGNVLVALSRKPIAPIPCQECHELLPESTACTLCGQDIPLHAAAALGCGNPACDARAWRRLFCPYCDRDIRGFVNGNPVEPADAGKSVTLIGGIIDLLAARARRLVRLAPDATTRDMLEGVIDYCATLKAEIPGHIDEHVRTMRDAQEILDKAQAKMDEARSRWSTHEPVGIGRAGRRNR